MKDILKSELNQLNMKKYFSFLSAVFCLLFFTLDYSIAKSFEKNESIHSYFQKGLLKLHRKHSSTIYKHKRTGFVYHERKSDGSVWSIDKGRHGIFDGHVHQYKVYRKARKGLIFEAEADQYGNIFKRKHKSNRYKSIPFKDLYKVK